MNTSNKALKPAQRAVFAELPIRTGKPAGWLRQLLERQRDGLTGHLDEIGYPFDTAAWKSLRVSRTREPYERNAYWVDGMMRVAHLLDSKPLLAKVRAYPQEFVRSKDIPLADGIPSSEEHLSGRGDLRTHETRNAADYTWSCGYLLMATGDPVWADRIERATFRSGRGRSG